MSTVSYAIRLKSRTGSEMSPFAIYDCLGYDNGIIRLFSCCKLQVH